MARVQFFNRSSQLNEEPRGGRRPVVAAWIVGLSLALTLGAISWCSPAVQAATSGGTSGGVPSPPLLGARPTGLIAVSDYVAGQSSTSAFTLTPAVFSDPSISGVALRINWSDIEPSNGTFEWSSTTDPVFAQAAESNKYVVLIFVPGFETPTWALDGVQTDSFTPQYGPLTNAGAGPMPLPMPWDPTYQSEWFTFLKAVAAQYGTNPAFRMIAVDGPTSVSEEASLPNKASDAAHPGLTDAAEWINDGYTSSKYEQAWQTTFENYAEIFPSQYLSLSVTGAPGGLGIAQASCNATCELDKTMPAIIGYGMQPSIKDRFVLQQNALREPGYQTWSYDLVSSNSGNVVTGFEVGAVNQEGISNPVTALSVTLQNGLAAHVDFLEVYSFDVLNPAMQTLLQQTASQLPYSPPITPKPGCHGSTCS